MEVIRDIIQGLFETWEKKKSQPIDEPKVILKNILTKQEKQHAQFGYFRKGVLGISVDSSVWLYQLNLKKESLLAKLRESFSDIKDIHLYLGEVKWKRNE